MTPLIRNEVDVIPRVSDDIGVNSDMGATPLITPGVVNVAGVSPHSSRDADVNPCVCRDVDVTLWLSSDVDVPPCSSGKINITPCVIEKVNVSHGVSKDVDVTPCVSSNSRLDPNAQCFVPRKLPMHDAEGVLKVHLLVKQSDLPNFQGCRLPVPTKLNICRWRELARVYTEPRDLDLLEYGFLISFQGDVHDKWKLKIIEVPEIFPRWWVSMWRKKWSWVQPWVYFRATLWACPLAISPIKTVPKSVSAV